MLGDKLIKKIRETRGNTPVAVILDPLTGLPDFEGYRPKESELPQEQPAAELIQHEVAGESTDALLARIVAAHEGALDAKAADDVCQ
ncbi:MAG: hypothetical protein UDB11_10150 [Peptococcaceae bacterium]|nr:hypothetical protein [Peptococcaceae bacterium]